MASEIGLQAPPKLYSNQEVLVKASSSPIEQINFFRCLCVSWPQHLMSSDFKVSFFSPLCVCAGVPVCVHVEARGQPWVFYICHLPCFLRQSLVALELTK